MFSLRQSLLDLEPRLRTCVPGTATWRRLPAPCLPDRSTGGPFWIVPQVILEGLTASSSGTFLGFVSTGFSTSFTLLPRQRDAGVSLLLLQGPRELRTLDEDVCNSGQLQANLSRGSAGSPSPRSEGPRPQATCGYFVVHLHGRYSVPGTRTFALWRREANANSRGTGALDSRRRGLTRKTLPGLGQATPVRLGLEPGTAPARARVPPP